MLKTRLLAKEKQTWEIGSSSPRILDRVSSERLRRAAGLLED